MLKRLVERGPRGGDDRLRRAPRGRRDPDRAPDAAVAAARARPPHPRLGRRADRVTAPAGPSRRARVHDVPGHDARAGAADPRGGQRAQGRRGLPPRLLARARRPRPRGLDDEERAEGRRRHRRGARPTRRLRSTAPRSTHVAPRLLARGRRADEAAREHLPLGQHRARQRARAAVRPDGHRRLGGRRRGRDEAVRLHVVPAGAGPRRPLHPGRPVLPHLEGARVRLLHGVHRARGEGQRVDAVLLPLGRLAGAEPRAAALAHGSQDPRPRRRVQAGHLRHARVARRSSSSGCWRTRARRSPTTTRTSRRSTSTASR